MFNMRAIGRVVLLMVALMSGIFSLAREALQFIDPAKYPEKSLFFACLRAACILAFALLWWQEKSARMKSEQELNNSKPKFVLGLGNIVWLYQKDRDLTVFFMLASITNSGQPSVALNWRGKYKVGTSIEEMEVFTLRGTYTVDIEKDKLSLTNDNLINVKTLETPVGKGQFVGGRIVVAIKGDRSEQIRAIRHTIEIECSDYINNKSTATYIPSPIPPDSLILHHAEKVERLADEVKVAAPEFPALGDGYQ
jgi:hypothetical protein